MSEIGIVLDERQAAAVQAEGSDAWWLYSTEVFDHVRLPYQSISPAELASTVDRLAVLIFATPPQDSPDIADWVRSGGTAITFGGPGELAALSGVSAVSTVVDGHVEASGWEQSPDVALRAFGGVTLSESGDVLARWLTGEPAVASVPVGNGRIEVWGADPWHSIVRIQQGFPVNGKGTPAPDGSVPMHDGILRCDDGLALDYDIDRAGSSEFSGQFTIEYPPKVAAPFFHRPHADLWRSLVLQSVFAGVERAGAPVSWLNYWPAGIPAIAHMSHDSDGNVDGHGQLALDAFAAADVSATWCHCHPGGYSPEMVAAVAEAGHEQSLHYNAREDTELDVWGFEQLKAQLAWAEEMTGERIVSNKNHYTRWEGWAEFYDWCERLGIEIDESRGPSKQGDIGFTFGSAHVWFPIADHTDGNRRYDVLELPLHTQDLGWFGHESVADVIIEQSLAVHGVAHFLFHGANMAKQPEVGAAVKTVADAGRAAGMPWWTAAQINEWERSRRSVRLSVRAVESGWSIVATAEREMTGVGILLAAPNLESVTATTASGEKLPTAVVTRHGRRFVELSADLNVGANYFVVA